MCDTNFDNAELHTYIIHNQFYTEVNDIPVDDEHVMDEDTKRIVNANNSSEKTLGGQTFGDDEVDFHGQTFGDDESDFHGQTFGDDEVDYHFKEPASLPLSFDVKVMCKYTYNNNYYVHAYVGTHRCINGLTDRHTLYHTECIINNYLSQNKTVVLIYV